MGNLKRDKYYVPKWKIVSSPLINFIPVGLKWTSSPCGLTLGIPYKVLYLVLNPFVYPLCWALLTGQAMFPAKHIVDRAIEDFIDNRKYPLTIKIILTPFYLLNYASGKCLSAFKIFWDLKQILKHR